MSFPKLIFFLIMMVSITACIGTATPEYPLTYYVQEGDTLRSIAEKYGVTTDKIIEVNNIAVPENLAEGQPLIIPLTGSEPTPARPMITDTRLPTKTHIPPTPTSVPPTATETLIPPTITSIPPTATETHIPPTLTSIPPTPTPHESVYILYFYFAPQGCPYCRRMAPVIQRFYEEYGSVASLHGEPHLALVGLKIPPPQIPKREVEVYGVPIYSWGSDIDGFRTATGITFPITSDPGLNVDTSSHPVTVLYNKQTAVYRVAARGVVSYQILVDQYDAFVENKVVVPGSGGT